MQHKASCSPVHKIYINSGKTNNLFDIKKLTKKGYK